MTTPADSLAAAIAAEFRRRLLGEYVPRIRRCVSQLTEAECWRRPGRHGNSICNLLLHLEGNVRQWILVGLAGEPDARDRDAEFRATPAATVAAASELVNRLQTTAERACAVVDRLGPDDLLATRTCQRRFAETGAGAVLHVLEHFAGHAGQIYQWTKQLRDVDLKFYDL
jgi:uncharacterized damage-inducible protein DinB